MPLPLEAQENSHLPTMPSPELDIEIPVRDPRAVTPRLARHPVLEPREPVSPRRDAKSKGQGGTLIMAAAGGLFLAYVFNAGGLQTRLDAYFSGLDHAAKSHSGVVTHWFVLLLPFAAVLLAVGFLWILLTAFWRIAADVLKPKKKKKKPAVPAQPRTVMAEMPVKMAEALVVAHTPTVVAHAPMVVAKAPVVVAKAAVVKVATGQGKLARARRQVADAARATAAAAPVASVMPPEPARVAAPAEPAVFVRPARPAMREVSVAKVAVPRR